MYVGSWMDDVQNGRGKRTKKNGDVFEGDFKKGLVDGEVIIHYANGNRFKGVYRGGRREGFCIEETKDGKRFEGTYRADRRDGKFVEKDRNGQVTAKGYYENGKRFEE